jgi:hypothetical protein
MKLETLIKNIKYTSKPYGDLLRKAEKTLDVNYIGNGTVKVGDPISRKVMVLYFETADVYLKNLTNGLIATEYYF